MRAPIGYVGPATSARLLAASARPERLVVVAFVPAAAGCGRHGSRPHGASAAGSP
ncbi:hypothetical protein [Pseudonocardia sp. N23]|uniref:hypothetical protein n=1 Tax=Pseudonocardia sp. N23 TaxID=1987376 RepID=UPI000C023446|nr:hypothetical protein [Pseudonocardia sp. N23]GAY12181.1 hypothetical protein TOK_0573 [Pseudonocardia sp. N23]